MAKRIYDVCDNDEYIGSYTPEVAEMVIGIPKYRVPVYAKNNLKYHDRYSFELIDSGPCTNREVEERLENDMLLTTRYLQLAVKAGWTRAKRQ